jgi:signal transduction histidine kinase/FixJ family two-component response regulator
MTMMAAEKEPALTPLRVLIVEDRLADAELMIYELERAGFEPAWKRVEREADYLAQLEAVPDIILADHTLPEFGAPRALDLLNASGLDIPLIVVTGSISEEVAVERLKQGAADYILKDRMARLGDAVARALREKRLREEKRRAEEALKSRYQELQTLQVVSQIILASPDIRTTMEKILDQATALGPYDIGVIRLFDPITATLTPVTWRGYRDAENVERHHQRTIDTMTGTMTARVMTFRKPRIEEDVLHTDGLRTWKREGVHSAIVIPVRADDEVLGIFQLGTRTPRKFKPDEIRLLEAISNQAGIAIQKARAQEETRRNLERIHALHEIDLAITSTLDLSATLEVLLQKIDSFLPGYSATTVRLFNKESGILEPVACRNLDEEEWRAEMGRAGRGIPNVVFETKAPRMVRNVQTDPNLKDPEFFRKHGLVSYLGVPLIAKDETLGVLSFYMKREHQFSAEEVEFTRTLAGQAAIAIHNAQLFEQTRKQATELERTNKVKDQFLSVMSHELRTPLSVVMGYTGMIKEGMLGEINPKQEEALQKVLSRAADQLNMINTIMETTQLEARAIAPERHPVNLSDFLRRLKSDYEAVHDTKEVALVWDYPSEPVSIATDSNKLRQILQNLINNAVKFTDKGTVTITARVRVGNQELGIGAAPQSRTSNSQFPTPNPQFVEFKVSDTGVGIAKEQLPLIFDKFFQADSSETRLYGGVGLGLYMVKKFTELLGGTVEVESDPGKGSMFTVTLPWEK